MLEQDQLNELRDLGGAFMSIREAAKVLQVPFAQLQEAIADDTSAEHQAYEGGRLESEFKVRQQVNLSAQQGSSPAQVLALKLIDEMKMANA